jgi:SPP1 gp7 family putative phage head morphogenesis protein
MAKSIPSDAYWAGRATRRMTEYLRDADGTLNTLSAAHQRALSTILDDLERIFGNYAKRHRLTPEEARAYLANPAGQDEYKRLLAALEGVGDPAARADLLARINAPAYRYRMSRLEALQESIRTEIAGLAEVELRETTEGFRRTISEAYGHTMHDIQRGTGLGFAFDEMSTGTVEEILRNPWSGLTYSERIWKNGRALSDWMQEHLTAGMMSGRSVARLARELADQMGVKYREAERLVRTETCYMANAAELQSYKEAGITHYRFLATLDNRTSEACQELDGHEFAVAAARPGENLPPMHPNCRSTTTAAIDPMTLETMKRRARNPVTGEVVEIGAWMSYEDWRQLMVDTYGQERVDAAMGARTLKTMRNDGILSRKSVVGGDGVLLIGRLDIEKYRAISPHIYTDEVVITDKQLAHITDKRAVTYERYRDKLLDILNNPDYVFEDPKHQGTALVMKRYDNTAEIVLRLSTESESKKNSILTMWEIKEARLRRYIKTHKVVYKKE